MLPGFREILLLGLKAVEHPASVTMDSAEGENATLAEKDKALYELIVGLQGGPGPSRERT